MPPIVDRGARERKQQQWSDLGSALGTILGDWFGLEWESPRYQREKAALMDFIAKPEHSPTEQYEFATNHPHAYKVWQKLATDRDKMEEARARTKVAVLQLGEAEYKVQQRKAFGALVGNAQRDSTGLDMPTLQRMIAIDPARTFDFLRSYREIRKVPQEAMAAIGGGFAQQYNIMSMLASVPEKKRADLYNAHIKELNRAARGSRPLEYARDQVHDILFDEDSGTLDFSDESVATALRAAATGTDAAGMAKRRAEALKLQAQIAKDRAAAGKSGAEQAQARARGFKAALEAIEGTNLPDDRKAFLTERVISEFMPEQGAAKGATLGGATAEAVDAVSRARGGGPADGTASPGAEAAPPTPDAGGAASDGGESSPGAAAGGSPTFNLEGVDEAVADAYRTLKGWLGGEGGQDTAAEPPPPGDTGPMGRGRPAAPAASTTPPTTREPGEGSMRDRAVGEVQGVVSEIERRQQQDQDGPMGRGRPADTSRTPPPGRTPMRRIAEGIRAYGRGLTGNEDRAGAETGDEQAQARAKEIMGSKLKPSDWTVEEIETVLKHASDLPRPLRRTLNQRMKELLTVDKVGAENREGADAPITIPETGEQKPIADMTLLELSSIVMDGNTKRNLSRAQLRALSRRLKELRKE